jgi:CheY-like chemotaxis protein/outer membrane biosynthesis protein TonB
MKRIIYLIGSCLLIFMASAAAAVETKYAIIIGTYESQANADRQLKRLEERFGTNETMVRLQEENGFDYLSEPVSSFYVVAIKPIVGKTALDQVFVEAEAFSSDSYVSLAQNYMAINYTSPTGSKTVPAAQPVVKADAPEPEAAVEPETVEKPQPAAKAAPVTPEPAKAEAKPAPVKPAAPLTPKPMPKADSGSDDLMLYGGIGVVVLLLLIMMIMRRKKAEEEAEPEIELTTVEPVQKTVEEPEKPEPEEAVTEEEIVQSAETAEESAAEPIEERVEPEEELPEAPHEVEEMPLPPEPEEAVEAEPFEEAVTEPEIETVEAPVEEVVIEPVPEEAVPEVPVAAVAEEGEAQNPRKKRNYKRGIEPISKENFKIFEGVRVLVAEDNMINQKVISGLLADTGIEITMANDGKEAVDMLEQDQGYAIVLMDAHMPVMDGFEATEAIRANPLFEKIPVIALSGDTAADDIRKMLEAGMEDHLEKPLHMDALYEVMYNFCDFEMETDEAEEEEIELLPDTPELHAEKGLDISMGDEELYREILGEFVQMYGKSDEQLHEFIVKDQYTEAGALLLDIRGIAANIGADPLAETAEQLREAFLNQDEKAYTELYNDYSTHLKAVVRDIEKV